MCIKRAFLSADQVITSLGLVVFKPVDPDSIYIDATIRRFMFSFDQTVKLLRLLLASKGIEVIYPKDVLREAFAGKLIDDEQMWLGMLRDRNLTSHTYDEDLAATIYANVKNYYPVMSSTLKTLKKAYKE